MSHWQPYLPYNALNCRYNEIGTKGKNRNRFEEQLADSLRRVFAEIGGMDFRFEHGRIFIVPKAPATVFSPDALEVVRNRAKAVAGLSSVSPGFLLKPEYPALKAVILEHFPTLYKAFMAQNPPQEPTYATRIRRVDKSFPMTATEMECDIADIILEEHPDLKLDLKNANLLIEAEMRYHHAFVSFERIDGPGGLPSGSAGRVLALLSGGIDSPVACYQMMRRGCTVDFVTFNSEPYTPPAYLTKVIGIARKLNEYQKRGKLYAVNILDAQKEIRDKCRSKHRTVLYRRFMMRVASFLAKTFGHKALVTGDNLGQVASQTLENMGVIGQVSPRLLLRPLLTFDKLDIMAVAAKIGTAPLSIEDVPDSCTVFAPKSPATRTVPAEIEAEEAKLDVHALVRECLKGTVIMNPRTYAEHAFTELLDLYG
jgi:thiamine biosynthesis protein ThiI